MCRVITERNSSVDSKCKSTCNVIEKLLSAVSTINSVYASIYYMKITYTSTLLSNNFFVSYFSMLIVKM